MPKVLVHLHLYYTDMWDELSNYLKNITVDYDLFVTMVENNEDVRARILSFDSKARICLVENRGFDMGAFMDVLNLADLKNYDYIIKMHSKRDMNEGTQILGCDVSGKKWRTYLLNFLRSRQTFEKCLQAFKLDKKLGMIGDFHLICKNDKANKEAVATAFEKLEALGLPVKMFAYVSGTMFMVRAQLFELVKKLNLTSGSFKPSVRGKDILPYGMEVFLGFVIGAQGYEIKDPIHGKIYQILAKICVGIKQFIWRKKVRSDGKIIIKICKIPLPRGLMWRTAK